MNVLNLGVWLRKTIELGMPTLFNEQSEYTIQLHVFIY